MTNKDYLSVDSKLREQISQWSKYFIGASLIIPCFVLTGWEFDIEFLKQPLPNSDPMNPMTAVAFILSSISFLLIKQNKRIAGKAVGYLLALSVLSIGCIKISPFISGYGIEIDNLFFSEKIKSAASHDVSPLMAPNSAFNFILVGIALLMLNHETRKGKVYAQLIAVIVAFVGLFSIVGYIYRVKAYSGILVYIPMAPLAAISFIPLSLAILFAQPGKGLMSDFSGPYAGSITSRLFVPVTVLIPVILGFIRLYAGWNWGLPLELGADILIMSIIITFLIIIRYNTKLLNKRDIESKNAENEIKKANNFLDAMLENIPNMIFVKDVKELRFIRFNKAGELLLGYSRSDLMGKNDYDFFPKEEADFFTKKDRDVIRKGELLDIPEEPISTTRGERLLHTRKITINDNLGNPTYLLGISEDITEQKKAEQQIFHLNLELKKNVEQLKLINRELEAFTYSVSHDLRAPLRIIDGYAEILTTDYKEKLDEDGVKSLHVIQSNARKMGQLIDDLLSFSRLGRKELVLNKIDMDDLVLKVLKDQTEFILSDHLKIKAEMLLPAFGDHNLLYQVWVNLISNAIKYSRYSSSPLIEIGSYKQDKEIIYFVKDNGVGFDMKYADKLFGIFQRLHNMNKFEGTGVGLAIVQRIVAKHKGRVWAEAEAEKGATFYFSLPAG